MEELFVPYELSVKLKEKGFDEFSIAEYRQTKTDIIHLKLEYREFDSGDKYLCRAPLYQQCLLWFMNEHKIYIQIVTYAKNFKQEWQYELIRLKISEYTSPKREGYNAYINTNDYLFSDYYEALNKGIEEALKLI